MGALVLALGSTIRRDLLLRAGVAVETIPARIDEEMIKASLLGEGAKPRDVADALAEFKARKISEKHPGRLVLGCDQVLDLGGALLSKPESRDQAKAQLQAMRGKRHMLLSAAVVCEDGKPIWRHVGQVRMLARAYSDGFIDGYLDRNWPDVSDSVGAYKLEKEGVRLFTRVDGDYFTVLGLPLLEFLAWMGLRGELEQ